MNLQIGQALYAIVMAYLPTTYTISGTGTVTNAAYAFDGNLDDSASVTATGTETTTESESITYQGFADYTPSSPVTLTIVANYDISGTTGCSATCSVGYGSEEGVGVFSGTSGSTFKTSYAVSIPAGVNLNTVTVSFGSSVQTTSGSTEEVFIYIYGIYI